MDYASRENNNQQINKINEKSKFVQSQHRCSCDAVKRIQLLMKLVRRV